jgi:deazaflavin-dependent oxidoreductase (nitroreductase family)
MIREDFSRRMKNIQRIHRWMYAIGFGPIIGRIILLLTTTGRRSGQKHVTPLQYEEINGDYCLGSARGAKADWYRNLAADCNVEVRVKNRCFHGVAECVTEPARVADFLETRLQRHPFMMGIIMKKAHGLPKHPSREQLLNLAASEATVIIHPVEEIIK